MRDGLLDVGVGLLFTLSLLSGGGCTNNKSPYSEGLDSPYPGARLPLIIEAGESKDEDKVRDLIQQLRHDDGAVRLYAIVALEKITGKRYGYQPYDPPAKREIAVEQWIQAYPPEPGTTE